AAGSSTRSTHPSPSAMIPTTGAPPSVSAAASQRSPAISKRSVAGSSVLWNVVMRPSSQPAAGSAQRVERGELGGGPPGGDRLGRQPSGQRSEGHPPHPVPPGDVHAW